MFNLLVKYDGLSWHEPHRKRVDTVPGVFRRQPLTFEHMAEVAAAIGAKDFYPVPVGVWFMAHRTGYFIVESGPTAAGVELVLGAVEWGLAATTEVGASFEMLVVFAREGVFRAFIGYDVLFLRRQRIPIFLCFGLHFTVFFEINLSTSQRTSLGTSALSD